MNSKNELSLSLAAGGACGAYQAGALLAFAEFSIFFNLISGTSVGTINGAYYSQGTGSIEEMQKLCGLWRDISRVGIVKFHNGLPFNTLSKKTLLDPNPLYEVLDTHLNYELICNSKKQLIITTIPSFDPIFDVLSGSFQQPVYFYAKDLEPNDLRNALFAATAIPFAFPSISINGQYFSDAGLGTPLPSTVLYEQGARRIVSIFLSDTHIQNRIDYPDTSLFQVRPSQNIFSEPLAMLNFSPDKIEFLIELGYRDTQKYLAGASDIFETLNNLKESNQKLNELMRKLPNK